MTKINTRNGSITGGSVNGVYSFLGIPYGLPPVGEMRFRAPEAHGPWAGTLDGSLPGSRAMQPQAPVGPAWIEQASEDCLFLNVYTPNPDSKARPVLVWIHGGGYFIGAGIDQDGSGLAAQGDVVVVTINYRLGVFGFLDLSKYDETLAGSASNAFRDQILALKWVRDNIADYGGDPTNVTIFGCSAGGASVNALLAAPSADGLFHRAISHSGLAITSSPPPLAEQLSAHLCVSEGELLQYLLKLSAEELLAAQLESGLDLSSGACVDGVVVTRSTYQAIAEHGAQGVPYIAGSNSDEGAFFTSFAPEGTHFDPMMAITMATPLGLECASDNPDKFLSSLKQAFPDASDKALYEQVWTESFRRSAIRACDAVVAGGATAWLYRFDLPSSTIGSGVGAPHGCEVPFTFNDFARPENLASSFHDPNDPVVTKLAERWSNTILAFARTGDPNGAGLPRWSPYSADLRDVLIVDESSRQERDPDSELRHRWGDA